MTGPLPHPDLGLNVQAQAGAARAATFETPHGRVETPAFMPVATRATVKGLTLAQVEALAPQVLLANTYHLHLRPGEAVVKDLGGLQGFTGWQRPFLTDSGGYQVFSLTNLVKVVDEGVHLKSHLDGEPLFLGPREAMAIQEALGADLVMAFDHCPGLPAPREAVEQAVARTTAWARACAAARTRDDQALIGIVQGGTDPELRERSARELIELDLPGYAVGGLAVGETPEELDATLALVAPLLPEEKPRYLMGVGMPPQILDAVARGIDLFDCVLPTRLGRRGHLMTADGVVRISSRQFERSDEPLDEDCMCEVCRRHSRGYLRHLFSVNEHTAVTLGTLHNLHAYLDLMRRTRAAILDGSFETFCATTTARFEAGEAAWREQIAEDPHGRQGSRNRREEQRARRRQYEER